MYSKVNYTIVGIFVVLFGAGILLFGFWLAKYGLQESYSLYKIEMKDSIAGLSKDSSVKLHGVDIGRVSEIRINRNDIEKIDIYVQIKEDVPIKEDMIASTQMLGVTGLLSIEIHGGTNAAKTLLATEKYIPIIKSKPSLLTKLTGNLGELSEKLNHLLEKSVLLLSDENLDNVAKILSHVEKVSGKGEALEDKVMVVLDDLQVEMKEITEKFAEATTNFKTMQQDFSEFKSASLPAIASIEKTSHNFNRVTLKVERSLDRGDYSLKKILEPAVVDMQILLDELSRMSRELDNSPSDLFFKSRKSRKGPGE